MKPSQLLIEIPDHTKSWPMPWLGPDKLTGFKEVTRGKVKVGDYVFIDNNEIEDTSATFDSNGNPSKYEDGKSYIIFNIEGEFGDCIQAPVEDFYRVYRPTT